MPLEKPRSPEGLAKGDSCKSSGSNSSMHHIIRWQVYQYRFEKLYRKVMEGILPNTAMLSSMRQVWRQMASIAASILSSISSFVEFKKEIFKGWIEVGVLVVYPPSKRFRYERYGSCMRVKPPIDRAVLVSPINYPDAWFATK